MTSSLVAFDLDGTLLKKNSSFAFLSYLAKKGMFPNHNILYFLKIYVHHFYFNLPVEALYRAVFNRYLVGMPMEAFNESVAPFLNSFFKSMLYQPAIEKLQFHQKNQDNVCILSSGPQFLVSAIADLLGVEVVTGSECRLDNEGRICDIATIVDGTKKAELLVAKQNILNVENTIAYSDSIFDLPFLEQAHTPVAVNPTRALKRVAKKRGWTIL